MSHYAKSKLFKALSEHKINLLLLSMSYIFQLDLFALATASKMQS